MPDTRCRALLVAGVPAHRACWPRTSSTSSRNVAAQRQQSRSRTRRPPRQPGHGSPEQTAATPNVSFAGTTGHPRHSVVVPSATLGPASNNAPLLATARVHSTTWNGSSAARPQGTYGSVAELGGERGSRLAIGQFEAMRGEIGSYDTRKARGMINIPSATTPPCASPAVFIGRPDSSTPTATIASCARDRALRRPGLRPLADDWRARRALPKDVGPLNVAAWPYTPSPGLASQAAAPICSRSVAGALQLLAVSALPGDDAGKQDLEPARGSPAQCRCRPTTSASRPRRISCHVLATRDRRRPGDAVLHQRHFFNDLRVVEEAAVEERRQGRRRRERNGRDPVVVLAGDELELV